MRKARIALFLLVPAIALGVYALRDHIPGTGGQSDQGRDKLESDIVYGDLPEVSFAMLDGARPIDLIQMDLAFPDTLKELDGRPVSLTGFMAPFDDLKDMRRCMIVPSYVGCTFCTPPTLTQVVFVTQGGDESKSKYPFIEEASRVSGIFRISHPESDHPGQQAGFLYSIENAVVAPHVGEAPQRAPGHATPNDHNKGEEAAPLPPVAPADLVEDVSGLLGMEALHSIAIEPVTSETFTEIIRADLESTYPEADRSGQAKAFSLLGLLPTDADWIETVMNIELTRRVAITNATGKEIYLLDSVPENHPYVRLLLVGEIAEALTNQHFPVQNRPLVIEGAPSMNGDSRRAAMALRQGLNEIAIFRYARSRGISTSSRPPSELGAESPKSINAPRELYQWLALPREVGPFFVDSLLDSEEPRFGFEAALGKPPATTMELFRPLFYQDASRWRPDPVREDFADELLETPPSFSDVLGIGGLLPWLSQWYNVPEAKSLTGNWTGDRWAIWQLPEGEWMLLLETRWDDEDSARNFRESIPYHPYQRVLSDKEGSKRVRFLRGGSESAFQHLPAIYQDAPKTGAP